MTKKYKVLNDKFFDWNKEMLALAFKDQEHREAFLDAMDNHFSIGVELGFKDLQNEWFSNAHDARMMFMSFYGGYRFGRDSMAGELESVIMAEMAIHKVKNVGKESNQA